VFTAVTSGSEVVVTFQLIPFPNTAALFGSMFGLVSHIVEKATRVRKLVRNGDASKRSITYSILGLF